MAGVLENGFTGFEKDSVQLRVDEQRIGRKAFNRMHPFLQSLRF